MNIPETKIQKARNNSLKKDGRLLLIIEKHLKQVGEIKEDRFYSHTFISKNKKYAFDTCLDGDRSDNFSNLFIKVYNLLESSNLKISENLFNYEKLFFYKIVELYDEKKSYSNIYKQDVFNLYHNLYNLFKANLLIQELSVIKLPSASLLAKQELDLKPIGDGTSGFDLNIEVYTPEPNYMFRHGIKMYKGNYLGIVYWALEGSDLYIEYKNGGLYRYRNLDDYTISSIEIARNFERTFQKHIKDKFECEKIEPTTQ